LLRRSCPTSQRRLKPSYLLVTIAIVLTHILTFYTEATLATELTLENVPTLSQLITVIAMNSKFTRAIVHELHCATSFEKESEDFVNKSTYIFLAIAPISRE
jgi:hypothetical protein